MPSAIFQGPIDLDAYLESESIAYTPRSGGVTKRVYKGKQEHILPLHTYYANSGWEVVSTRSGPVMELVVTINQDIVVGEQDPIPQWEISGHQGEQNVLECSDRPYVQDLTTKAKNVIELQLKNPASDALYEADSDTDNIYDSMKKVYDLMATGVEGKQIWTPVVQRNVIVSSQYVSNWSTDSAGIVLSKGTLVNGYNVPHWVSNLMPDSSNFITDVNGVESKWGYLEQYPTYRSVGGNKVQISQAWVYNKWSTLLYPTN